MSKPGPAFPCSVCGTNLQLGVNCSQNQFKIKGRGGKCSTCVSASQPAQNAKNSSAAPAPSPVELKPVSAKQQPTKQPGIDQQPKSSSTPKRPVEKNEVPKQSAKQKNEAPKQPAKKATKGKTPDPVPESETEPTPVEVSSIFDISPLPSSVTPIPIFDIAPLPSSITPIPQEPLTSSPPVSDVSPSSGPVFSLSTGPFNFVKNSEFSFKFQEAIDYEKSPKLSMEPENSDPNAPAVFSTGGKTFELQPIEVKTLEEDEDILFESRAKLYRFNEGEWKERGVGIVKILQHKQNGRTRVLMRREKILKICANHYLSPDMNLKLFSGDKSYTWQALDYSDEEAKLQTLAIKFATTEFANSFKEAFEKAKQDKPSIVKSPQRQPAPAEKPTLVRTAPVEEESNTRLPIVPEEKEDIFCAQMRARLFTLFNNQWKERASGFVKLLQNKETKHVRLLVRRERTLEICANHFVSQKTELKADDKQPNSWTWSTSSDLSQEEAKPETFSIQFSTSEMADSFKAFFDKAREIAKSLPEVRVEQKKNTKAVKTKAEPSPKPKAEPSPRATKPAASPKPKSEPSPKPSEEPKTTQQKGKAQQTKVTQQKKGQQKSPAPKKDEKLEEQARAKAEEAKAAEEARVKEEESRLKAEEEAKARAKAEEARLKAEEARLKAEEAKAEEARAKAEAEAARAKAEAEAKKQTSKGKAPAQSNTKVSTPKNQPTPGQIKEVEKVEATEKPTQEYKKCSVCAKDLIPNTTVSQSQLKSPTPKCKECVEKSQNKPTASPANTTSAPPARGRGRGGRK